MVDETIGQCLSAGRARSLRWSGAEAGGSVIAGLATGRNVGAVLSRGRRRSPHAQAGGRMPGGRSDPHLWRRGCDGGVSTRGRGGTGPLSARRYLVRPSQGAQPFLWFAAYLLWPVLRGDPERRGHDDDSAASAGHPRLLGGATGRTQGVDRVGYRSVDVWLVLSPSPAICASCSSLACQT